MIERLIFKFFLFNGMEMYLLNLELIFKQKLSLFYHAKHILSMMKGCANYSENYIE